MLVSGNVLLFIIAWMFSFFAMGAWGGFLLKRRQRPETLRKSEVEKMQCLFALLLPLGERIIASPPQDGSDALFYKADADCQFIVNRMDGYDQTLVEIRAILVEVPPPCELQGILNMEPQKSGQGSPIALAANFLAITRLHAHGAVLNEFHQPTGPLPAPGPIDLTIAGVRAGLGRLSGGPSGLLGMLLSRLKGPGAAKARLKGMMAEVAKAIIIAGKPTKGSARSCEFWRIDPDKTQKFLVQYEMKQEGLSGFAVIDFGNDGNTITFFHADKSGGQSQAL
jgi:hypothetical protein